VGWEITGVGRQLSGREGAGLVGQEEAPGLGGALGPARMRGDAVWRCVHGGRYGSRTEDAAVVHRCGQEAGMAWTKGMRKGSLLWVRARRAGDGMGQCAVARAIEFVVRVRCIHARR
jgi:hypothetical protein